MGALIGALSKMTAVEPMQYTLMILDKIFTGHFFLFTLLFGLFFHRKARKNNSSALHC